MVAEFSREGRLRPLMKKSKVDSFIFGVTLIIRCDRRGVDARSSLPEPEELVRARFDATILVSSVSWLPVITLVVLLRSGKALAIR